MSNCINYEGNQFVVNQQASLYSDRCAVKVDEKESAGPGEYLLSNYHSCECGAKDVESSALNQPSVMYRDGYGIQGCKIDDDSNARFSQQTNPKLKQQLFQRPYATVPYMGNGCHYPDKESQLLFSEQTGEKRSCNVLAGVTIDNYFTPMIDCLKDNIQNPKNLIEETYGWTRGGISTRHNLKQVDYARRCLPEIKRGPVDPNIGNNEVPQ